jgi:type IV secretion system protein VirD4
MSDGAPHETLYQLPTFSRQRRQAVLFNALFFFLLNTLLAFLHASEYLAVRWRFHPALGHPWFHQPAYPSVRLLVVAGTLTAAILVHSLRRRTPAILVALPGLATVFLATAVPLYRPLAFVAWHRDPRFHVAALRPGLERSSSLLVILIAVYFVLTVAYTAIRLASHRTTGDVHGSSHWATPAEVERTGLLSSTPSVVVGAWHDGRRVQVLRDPSDRHLLLFAPSRSGKTTALVIPTLLEWPHSAVVLDIKSELWQTTAGHRESELGNVCLRFDPASTDEKTARYNPLLTIPADEEAVKYAMALADVLVDPDGKNLARDFWQSSAHSLIVSVILHVLFAEPNKTLAGCYYFIANPARPLESTLLAMLKTQHDPELRFGWVNPHTGAPTATHPVIASGARAALDMEVRTRSGVIATALTYLDIFRDPIIARNTATSDFTAEDLMNFDSPVTLYLTIAPAELTRLRALIRIVLNQICQRLTYRMEFASGNHRPRYAHPLLLLLDEFTALGKLDFFGTAIGYLAGYGIRVMLSIQSLAALHEVYGENQSITTNCPLQIAFAPADHDRRDDRQLGASVGLWRALHGRRSPHAIQRGRVLAPSPHARRGPPPAAGSGTGLRCGPRAGTRPSTPVLRRPRPPRPYHRSAAWGPPVASSRLVPLDRPPGRSSRPG